MYVAWATFVEGSSDSAYLDVIIPRLMSAIILRDGIREENIPASPAVMLGRKGRSVEIIAAEACENSTTFYLLFIHADTGGRGLAGGLAARSSAYVQAIYELCGWPVERCVLVMPKHETEAWALSDPDAVLSALGFSGTPTALGLPANAAAAERLSDPKAVLAAAARQVQGRRFRPDASSLLATIAQRQSLDALRQSSSFRDFETSLRAGLMSLGCLA